MNKNSKSKVLYVVSKKYVARILKNGRLKYEKDEPIFLPLDNSTKNRLQKGGFKIIDLREFNVLNSANSYGAEFINRIKSAKINNHISLSNYLSYKNINLVDLIDTEFLILFLENFIRQLDLSIRLIHTFKPDKVIIAANSHDWASLVNVNFDAMLVESIRPVSNAKDIPVIDMSSGLAVNKFSLICIVRPYLKFVKDLILTINSSVRYLVESDKSSHSSREKIIFLNHSFSSNTVLPVMNESRKNQYLNTLLVQISGSPSEVGEEHPKSYKRWNYFFHMSVFLKMFRAWFSLKHKLKILRRSNFWDGIKYSDVKIGELVREVFIYFAATRLLSAIKFIEMANLMFKSENVKFVVTPEERILPNRAICAAACCRSIPTLLIQRGLYGDHPLYRFPFLVDKVALDGGWVKEALRKMGHSISKLEVTGQPAYDLLREKYNRIDRTTICSKYNLDINNSKVVLYTSQPILEGLSSKNNRMPKDVFMSHKQEVQEICLSLYSKEGIFLLIKPHPNENDDLHHEIVDELGAENIKVVSKKANTYELISISSILVTRHSTTGLEAIILDKPVIIVNLLGIPDSFPYVDYGSALGVYRRENIWPVVKSVLQDKRINDRLKEGRVRFITDFAYKIDGESSKRIAALMNDMIKRIGGVGGS